MLRTPCICVFGLLASLIAPRGATADTAWFFVWAEPDINDYRVSQGTGTVTLKDGLLVAELRSDRDKHLLELRVVGHVANGKVMAKVSAGHGENHSETAFSGTHTVRGYDLDKEGLDPWSTPWRTETIFISDGLRFLVMTRHTFGLPPKTPRR